MQGLSSMIPCIFQPAGIVSVAAVMLFSVGSVMVAVVSWELSGAELIAVSAAEVPNAAGDAELGEE